MDQGMLQSLCSSLPEIPETSQALPGEFWLRVCGLQSSGVGGVGGEGRCIHIYMP